MKFVMVTPGISIGYWNDMKIPAQERSSGDIASRSLPMNVMLPSVTVYNGLPVSTLDNVLLPAPLGPMTAWISPFLMTRSMPYRVSFSPTEACTPLISNNISFAIILTLFLHAKIQLIYYICRKNIKGVLCIHYRYVSWLRLYPQNLTQVMLPQGLKTILSADRGKTSPNDV